MNALDVMTWDPVTVRAEATLPEAAQLMLDWHVSSLPVLDAAGQLVGILTEGDLLRPAEPGTDPRAHRRDLFLSSASTGARFVQMNGRLVCQVMTRDLISVEESTPLEHVVALMRRGHVRRIVVMRGEALVGIVVQADLLRALAELLERPSTRPDDAALETRLLAALDRWTWYPTGLHFRVAHGHVEIFGTIFKQRDRQAIRIVAANVPGVVSLQDHLVFVEQETGLSTPQSSSRVA